MKVTLFVPTRNEITGVKRIMPLINPSWVDEILVIDANSTDGTREYMQERGYRVIPQKTLGIAGAYWECLEVAQGDAIIAFSPDGNSLIETIPVLAQKMHDGYDMVIASRYLGNAKSEDDDPVTAFGNWMFTKMVNLAFGGNYTDTLVMLRAFRKDLAARLGMRPDNIPVFEYELSMFCAKFGMKVAEIPADEPKRFGDERKMRPIYNGSCLVYSFLRALFHSRPQELGSGAITRHEPASTIARK